MREYVAVPKTEYDKLYHKPAAKSKECKKMKPETDGIYEEAKKLFITAVYKQKKEAAAWLGRTLTCDELNDILEKEWAILQNGREAGTLRKDQSKQVEKYISEAKARQSTQPAPESIASTKPIAEPITPDRSAINTLRAALTVTKAMKNRDIQNEPWFVQGNTSSDKKWKPGDVGRRPAWATAGLLELTLEDYNAKRKELINMMAVTSPAASSGDGSDGPRVEDVDDSDDDVKENVADDDTKQDQEKHDN